MLPTLRPRRRPRYGAKLCAVVSALLLLFSVSLLHTRLSSSPHHHRSNRLVSDSEDAPTVEDKIDELDSPDAQEEVFGLRNDVVDEDDDAEGEMVTENGQIQIKRSISSSGYYVDHVTGSIRRSLRKRSIDEWETDYGGFSVGLGAEDRSKGAFGSDDVPVDEDVRRKVSEISGIEEALMLKIGKKVSPLREGWGDWFDKKGDFLRRDRMFKSNLEVLNPLNNPLLQDPDGAGVTGLTRGDKAVQKMLLNEFKKTPFLVKKPLGVSDGVHEENVGESGGGGGGEILIKKSELNGAERRTLDENGSHRGNPEDGNVLNNVVLVNNSSKGSDTEKLLESNGINNSSANGKLSNESRIDGEVRRKKSQELGHVYADGKTWGYFPGLHPHLSFSDFLDSFFRKGKCDMRVFMVWNSPPWMFGVRYQRGIESLLSYHKDACVVVLTETMELDFFKDSFVKDGYKVAVAMPNLDELLKDTPTHIFASVWFQWRKTKFYSTHYSELVRLAALYKYGGIYLDSDIIVLNPLSSLNNTVGLEDQVTGSSLNGAVMAFRKHSPFLKECLEEFYLTYDDTKLRWNGADLLTRVAKKFLSEGKKSMKQQELKVQPPQVFFPISSRDISSYFATPATEKEETQQSALLAKIVSKSLTFHFWNSLTSSLVPEPGSLVAKLINTPCIRCFDIL